MRVLALLAAFTLLTFLPAAHADDAVLREPYEIGPDYAFEFPVPECADKHVACFALTGAEAGIHLAIADFQSLVLPASAPIAAHVLAMGPTGFTTGYLCGEGQIDFPVPRTFVRVEIALGGVGECTWSSEEDPLADVVAGVPTRGEVILKTLAREEGAAVFECPELGPARACVFAGATPHMTGAQADAHAGDASIGAGAIHGAGFYGPLTMVDVHGGYGEHGWHGGFGASDYDFDSIPDSTCACAGVWSYQTGYVAIVSVGHFDLTGDGPSPDDTFAAAGTSDIGIVYGWSNGEPGVAVYLP